MNTTELSELMQKILKEMEVKGYKEQTINSESNTFNQLIKYCENKKINNYNLNVGMDFLEEHYHLSMHKTPRYRCRRLRSIYLLEWYLNGKDITKMTIPRDYTITTPKEFMDIINDYKEYLILNNYSQKTINYKVHSLNLLFEYALNNKVTTYQNISKELIYNFLDNIKDKYVNETIYTMKYHIKNFYDYLYNLDNKFMSGKSIFPKILKCDREKLPSYYTKDEIKKVLSLIDTNTKIGKRDYAVLLIAITYGLRNSDIVNLTFENIDWIHNKIVIIQYKTKEKLELSLTEQVKLSLIDYIKNARPKIDSNKLFLRFRFPYEYNGNKSLYKSFEKYLVNSNIEIKGRKKGIHSLRHSCATNLLSNNVQLPVISSILGHKSVETTKKYISIEKEQLKKISLEVPDYE